MSLKTASTSLCRTLWARGSRTPPVGRSPEGSRVCTTSCRELGGTEQLQQEEKNNQNGGEHSCSEPPHSKCPSGDKKRLKEAVGAPGVPGVRRRCFTSKAAPKDQTSYLWTRYNDMKRLVYGKHAHTGVAIVRPPPTHPHTHPQWATLHVIDVYLLAAGTFCTFSLAFLLFF